MTSRLHCRHSRVYPSADRSTIVTPLGIFNNVEREGAFQGPWHEGVQSADVFSPPSFVAWWPLVPKLRYITIFLTWLK